MTRFDEATAVKTTGQGTYEARLDATWSVGDKLHGGYLMAVLARAALESAAGPGHPHVTAVSASFAEPPEPGPAEVLVEVLRAGRTVTQVRAELAQQGRPRVAALVTLGLLDDADPRWTSAPAVEMPPEESCFLAPREVPGNAFPVPLMDVLELRLHPEQVGFVFGEPSLRGRLDTWQRLKDGAAWDPLSLLLALDPVPPASYDLGLPGWAPTIQLTAHVLRLPAPGPVKVRLSVTEVGGGRMDETAMVWDSRDRLVAQATQLAAIRVPA
ncbi:MULTISPECIES: thioesterase family protein [Nonomuraea]|uniref:Thioesterase family protein n=2 Tax=Nonomuraea TaxID=83681 RepID=A0ABW1C0C7_9ACTN|nr:MULTISPECIES: thioesterase family protein [Nonomuraea]MDA0640301.1 thioesterase family protein [Nonomuraea ferruginea]